MNYILLPDDPKLYGEIAELADRLVQVCQEEIDKTKFTRLTQPYTIQIAKLDNAKITLSFVINAIKENHEH